VTEKEDKHAGSRVTALALYTAAGWVAVEILFAIRERLGLPEVLDDLALGIFIAGFVVTALTLATGRTRQYSPLVATGRVLAIATIGSATAFGIGIWLGNTEPASDIPSVAVLPCNYEGAEDHAFLGPAAAQEVHAKLARVAGVQIPAWRSVLKSVQVGEDERQIAEILRVTHLANCTITEAGDRIELATTIIDPEREAVLWSGRQTYASADLVFALSEISRGIADALSVRMTVDESDRLARAPTNNPEAYEHYLRARQAQGSSHWYVPNLMSALEIGEEEYELAMSHYRKAVELDPTFAEAWAGMATATRGYASNVKGEDRFGAALKSYGEQAYEYAERALSHDPCNAEALLLHHRTSWIATPEKQPPVADRVWQSDPAWRVEYERDIGAPRQAIDCEPNNAVAWRQLANIYSNFAIYPSVGNEYPAEQMRASLMKALALDPTNCRVQEYYISTFSDPFWAPRLEDRLSLDEKLQAIHSALLVNPDCSALYQLLADIAEGHGRLDEAIAWHMRRHELAPDNPNVGVCEIATRLNDLGFVEEAEAWAAKASDAGFYWCWEYDLECVQSREAFYSENCKAQRLDVAKEIMSSSWSTASPVIRVFKYRSAMYEAQTSDRLDLVRQWLDEGLEDIGSDDPVTILGKNPKRLISARHEGLELVPIFRDLGLDDAAERMLELCRRDPSDPKQVVFRMGQFLYVDARHRSLAGYKAEAIELLARALRLENKGWLDRYNLLFDRALDPLREDPVYAPQLEALIDEYYDWLAPARERTATALETGDWASLRTLIDESPDMLAVVDPEAGLATGRAK
jgi:tetratricopeptide (TPR) repeat protein